MRALVVILIFLVSGAAFGQGAIERQHPRVSELQDKLTEYARDYLKSRLPDIPYLVTVRIEPLRRDVHSGYRVQNEKLPYFEMIDEEIRDEWDDPSASLYVLQSRLQKATVSVTLPQSLKDAEVDEIKDSLTTLLRLVPGRDEVRVERRSWSLGVTYWYYVGLSVGLVTLLLLGMVFVNWSWSGRLSRAIMQIKSKDGEKSEPMSPVQVPGSMARGAEDSASGHAGDLKFSDPLRTREFIGRRVQELSQNPCFPNLEAMLLMDRVGRKAPRELGALLMEFPKSKQEEIFSLSHEAHWIEAFADPGELGPESLELIDRLSRLHFEESERATEELKIQFWRLGELRASALKDMERDEAFAILHLLPSSISIPAGRVAFPGAWAVLLEPDTRKPKLSPASQKRIIELMLTKKPRIEYRALETYRQERDLLEYLLTASVLEEREIYEALPTNSQLPHIRPPFYCIFEAEPEMLKMVFERVTLDEWSLSLFNVSREMRKLIEDQFSSKQKYIFISKMRSIDSGNVDRRSLGYARQRIGQIYSDLMQTKNQIAHLEPEGKAGEANEEAA